MKNQSEKVFKGTLRYTDNVLYIDHFGQSLPVHLPELKKLWGNVASHKIAINQHIRFAKVKVANQEAAKILHLEDLEPKKPEEAITDETVNTLYLYVSTVQFLLNLIDEWNINEGWASHYFRNLMHLTGKEIERTASIPFVVPEFKGKDVDAIAEQHMTGAMLAEQNMRLCFKFDKLSNEKKDIFEAEYLGLLKKFNLLEL